MLAWNFKNFSRSEFECNDGCNILDYYEENYLYLCLYFLQPLREDINKPFHIISGIRCVKHNKEIGGFVYSYHTDNGVNFPFRPTAVDFKVYDLPQYFVADRIKENTNLNYCGYKMYIDRDDYCQGHIDFRGYKARW